MREAVFKRVWVTGGLSNTPGFVPRLAAEIRENLPSDFYFEVSHHGHTDFYIRKMDTLASLPEISDRVITRKSYEEYGSYALSQVLF